MEKLRREKDKIMKEINQSRKKSKELIRELKIEIERIDKRIARNIVALGRLL